MNKYIKLAVACLALYAVLFIGLSVIHLSDFGYREYFRAATRLTTIAICIYGLLKLHKWGWWLSVIIAGLYGTVGAAGIFAIYKAGFTSQFSGEGIFAIVASSILFLSTTFLLLLPSAREQVFRNTAMVNQE